LTALERIRLLIVDDWEPEPLDSQQRRDLLEIVGDRHDKGSLLRSKRGHDKAGSKPISE